jgi:hypothetical protein
MQLVLISFYYSFMKKFYSYSVGLCLAVALVGCGKDDSDDAKPNTPTLTAKETLLTSKNWRISAVSVTHSFFGQTINSDGYAQLSACKKDDFIKYNADKTAVGDEGATKCSTSDPQTSSFTWAFNSAETELTHSGTINGTATSVKAEVLQLTATTLQIRTTNVQTQSGVTSTSTATTTYTAF